MFDQNTLNSAWGGASATPKQAAPAKKKGPGGIAGFLVNSLPAIGGGLGAIAGIPGDLFSAGGASIAGGAAGAGLGEAVKRKILGQSLDPKQIAIQAAEGGVTAGLGSGLKAASTAAKGFAKGGAQVATKTAEKTAAQDTGSTFLKNLTTQGQQAQGRVSGISAGSKAAGKELTPQDTTKILDTFKTEGIQTGNANNTLRDVVDKQKTYGQQIADHFKTNNAPLHPDDTKQIANNFIAGLKTTDPGVLKQAQIVADDLENNVKSTKDLWDFRKTLDTRIPKGNGVNASNKTLALKGARRFIANELGNVPGMKNYHDLSEAKPFISAEAKRLNNPSGGVIGRVLSSGPAQAAENIVGKGAEKIGQKGARGVSQSINPAPTNILEKVLTKKGIPVKYESDTLVGKGVPESKKATLTNPNVGELSDTLSKFKDNGYSVNGRLGSTPGRPSPDLTPNFTPIEQSSRLPSIELTANRTAIPLAQQGAIERGIIHTPDEYGVVPHPMPLPTPVGSGFLDKLLKTGKSAATLPARIAATPLAFPGQSAGAVLKQEATRGFGVPASAANAQQQQATDSNTSPDLSSSILQASSNSPADSNSPYAPENAEANVQAILQQGGTQKDVSDYLANVKNYQALQNASGSTPAFGKPTAQQHALAKSAVGSLQQLFQMIEQDPSIINKNATPGQGTPIVGSLITNGAGAGGYHSLADNVLSSLIHLQTGATATKEEITSAHGQLPQPGDSAEERQQKIQTLLSNFEPFLSEQ